jgi:hypothetical protein
MDINAIRRQQLEDGLQKDLELLVRYEDKLRLSDDPKEQVRCCREIEVLKASIADKEAELRSLVGPEPSAIPPAGERPADEWPCVDVEHLHALITDPDGPDSIWLLGAGASWKSGVPVSGALVERAAKWGYCRAHRRAPDDPTVMRSDWLPWLHRQPWHSMDQPPEAQYVTALSYLLQPAEERREFFRRLGRPGTPPSEGYHRLLDLMATRRVRTVLTTNFDAVLSDLSITVRNPRHVTIIRSPDNYHHISTAPTYPQVIYLHGDAERYADCYFDGGYDRLDHTLVEHIIPLLRDHPIIVVGYGGAEPAVMHHLLRDNIERVHRFCHGLYWCVLTSEYPHRVHPFVGQLADAVGPNLRFVPIESFDELLVRLWEIVQVAPSAVFTLALTPTATAAPTFDLRIMDGATLDDLDWPTVQSRLVEYCRQMNIAVPLPVTREWLVEQMQVQGLAANDNDTVRPTVAGTLLFATDITNRLATARIEVHVAGEEPRIFSGNLWQQVTVVNLIENELNIPFRLKGPTSETVTPYPRLALKELIVNALAHRRYDGDADEAIVISVESDHITITNPGGLHEEARRQLPPDVRPEEVLGIRPIKGYRNPVIADLFYSSGEMDKLGSGLLDVRKWARQNEGDVDFRLGPDDSFFEVTLYRRPERPDEQTGAASPLTLAGEFISNILEVTELPDTVWSDETTYRWGLQILREARDQELPAFVLYEGRLYTFSDLSRPDNPLRRFIQAIDTRPMPLCNFATDGVGERRLVHLLNEALRGFIESNGLIFDWDRKQAYFPRTNEGERAITYKARLRQATRTVVKARISPVTNEVTYWEHQALVFQFKRFGDVWGLQLLPTYVFTSDGYYARLPGERSGPLATQRLSREYNVHVDSHLVFWTTMFSNGASAIFLEDSFGSRIVLRGLPAACTLRGLEPHPGGEEPPLLSEEDLDELEDQMVELNGEDWEDDEPDD